MPSIPDVPGSLQGAYLRVNRHCNQSCLFCSVSESAEDERLPPVEVLGAIDACARGGTRTLTLTGGEPAINPQLLRYARRANEAGVQQIVLETNATPFAKGDLAQRLAAAHPRVECFVSLHSHRADVSDFITQDSGGHGRALRGVDALVGAGCSVTFNHVLCRLNVGELPQFVDFVADRFPTARCATLSFVAAVGRAAIHSWIIPPLRDVRPLLRAGIRRGHARGVRLRIPDRCGIPLCIAPDVATLHQGLSNLVPSGTSRDHRRGASCGRCALGSRCAGLWRGYFDLYGDGELRPLHENGGGSFVADVEETPASSTMVGVPPVEVDGSGLPAQERSAYLAGEVRFRVGKLVNEARRCRRRRLNRAVSAIYEALRLDPENGVARQLFEEMTHVTHVERALALIRQGDRDRAREILRWVLSVHRKHRSAAETWRLLGPVSPSSR